MTELRSGKDLIMWIGYHHYPTITDFIEEAQIKGVSKRVSRVPRSLIPGKTRLFFVHDEGFSYEGRDPGDAVVFGYCEVGAIEMIVDGDEDLPSRDNVSYVQWDSILSEDERGCGYRELHGLYLRTEPDQLHLLTDPIDYNSEMDPSARRFRGFCAIDGDSLLGSNHHKPYPTDRADVTLSEDLREVSRRAPWSPEERTALLNMVNGSGPHHAAKEFSRQTNRTFQACIYQLRGMRSKVELTYSLNGGQR